MFDYVVFGGHGHEITSEIVAQNPREEDHIESNDSDSRLQIVVPD